jgi:hypothetical protein
MHNCKTTKERITELLLNGTQTQPAELLECSDCSSEFESLKETLRISRRQIEVAVPGETYWNGYHARLRNRLVESGNVQSPSSQKLSAGTWLRRMITASIRVPVPVGAALLMAFALSMFFVTRRAGKVSPPPSSPSVSFVQVPIEVPVIQEKVVTKVVYRESKRKAASSYANQSDLSVAKSQKANVPSLVGFKPPDEVKLTVIKGGSPDEK